MKANSPAVRSAALATVNGAGMPVVLYLRKSNKTKNKSRDESVSIDQQRRDLYAWCEQRGWVIVREYVDDGKSASKNDRKRKAFHELLTACERADFRAVVVWDLSRLTRRNSVDAGDAAKVLMRNNIIVESLRDGEFDLTTSTGRTMFNLHAESNSEFAKKVSGGTIRGRDDSLSRGNWPHGKVPYGYDREYWEGSQLVKRMHRRDPAGKARHWTTRIVPNEAEAPIAAKIIRDFATRDVSVRGLAIELQREGAPTMTGKAWNAAHVRAVIRCPAYVGDHAIGYSEGWAKRYEAHGHSDQQTKADACPAIIDRSTWERANAKLANLKTSGRRVQTHKASPLSGIIYCGHCGKAMVKSVRKGVTRFTCSTAAHNSANGQCAQWTVHESDLMKIINRELVKGLDWQILQDMEAKPPESQATTLAVLKSQETDLARKVKTAARNLALCDEDSREEVQAVLTELKTELEAKRNTIHIIETAADKTELQRIADWWHENRTALVPVKMFSCPMYDEDGRILDDGGEPMTADFYQHIQPEVYRDLLKRLNARLVLHFTPKAMGPNSKRQYYAVEWGRLQATLDVQAMNGSGPARTSAPAALPCASRSPRPGRFSASGLATGPSTPASTAGSFSSTRTSPTRACY